MDTDIDLTIRLYNGSTPVVTAVNAVILVRDSQLRLLWAGVTSTTGNISGTISLPAAAGSVTLYIYKDRFGERTITIDNLARLRKLSRSLYLQNASTSGTAPKIVASQKLSFGGIPNLNLTGPDLTLIDNDADGVPDAFDDFPLDPSRAFKINIPVEQYFTMSFEDLFPVVGDGDYNDFTARYGITHTINAQNQLVEITGRADAIARLAGYRHRFGLVIRFAGYSATLDVQKAGANCSSVSSSSQAVSNLANINLFESTDLAFTAGVGHHTSFVLHFNSPIFQGGADLPPYDPYVYVHNTGKDIHLIGKPPLPGSANPAAPVGFRDNNGFPWAMLVPNNYKYPKEGMFIENAYPQFALWRQSLGLTNQDWYNFPVAANVISQPAITTCASNLQALSTIPANIEASLPTNSVIRIFFNQSIDPKTVVYQNIQLLLNNAPINGNLTVAANEVTFTPASDLAYGLTYLVKVSSNLKGITGDQMQNDFLFSFSTELTASTVQVRELDLYTEGLGKPFVTIGNDTYFGATEPSFGTELWRTDGTYAGTTQIRDLNSGVSSTFPQYLTAFNGKLLFSGQSSFLGIELASSDGSLSGTNFILDHNPGNADGRPEFLISLGPLLLYVTDDGVHGRELWKNNGSSSAILADLNANAAGGGLTASSSPKDLTLLNSSLFFTADDGIHGRELFVTDGSAAGTTLVKDLRVGAASASPQNLTASNGKVYFTAYDGTYGNELFESDGTGAGTLLKADIYPGGSSSFPANLIDAQGRLFFTASDDTHGTELFCLNNGLPQLSKDITLGSLSSSFGEMIALGGIIIFVRNGLPDGDELWRSDCTDTGTYMIRKLNPGNIQYLVLFQGQAYFSANDGLNGQELWRTDGTFSGTLLARNIKPGPESSNPSNLHATPNRLYFRIYDQFSAFPEALWKYEP